MSLPRQIARYEVQSRIGRGGMGSLYLARDPKIDRLVAIKVLNAELDRDELRIRFDREARSAGALNHPNIVTIFDYGVHEDAPYLVMEYIRGETLAELIKRRAPLPVEHKIGFLGQLCRGLGYAHDAGIIHRDIKPANLMIDQHDVLKILDFGIARLTESGLTQGSVSIGTPGYMSPEQVQGRPVERSSDLFAVGAVAYELLTYRPAFYGNTHHAILHSVLHDTPTPIAYLVPDVDPQLIAIVERAMAKSPAERFTDAASLEQALHAIRAHAGPSPRTPWHWTPSPAPGPALSPADTPTTRARPSPGGSPVSLLIERVRQAFAAGELAHAQSLIDKILAIEPHQPEALDLQQQIEDARIQDLIGKARSGLAEQRFTEAAGLVSEALKIRPRSETILKLRAEIDDRRVEAERRIAARTRAKLAIERGRSYIKQRAWEAARRAADEALALEPDNADAVALRERSLLADHAAHTPTSIARYEVLNRIASGGMGSLFLARDPNIDRLVAVKLLHTDLGREDVRERFAREARSAGAMTHANIVTIFDYGVANDTPFIVMEYVRGETVAEIIKRRAPMPLLEKLVLLEQLCRGLGYAHDAGVIHRDVKPANLMVDHLGGLKILDFGIARVTSSGTTSASALIGTPGYMSPEQIDGHHIGRQSDLFAVGAVAYELLSYSPAFTGDSHPAVLHRVLNTHPPPVASIAPEVGPDVAAIVDRALQKKVENRYQDAGSVIRHLQAARHTLETAPPRDMGASGARVAELVRRASASLDAGRVTEVADLVAQALDLQPQSESARQLKSRLESRRLELALQAAGPSKTKAAIGLGTWYLNQKAWGAAKRAAQEALARDPTNLDAMALRDAAEAGAGPGSGSSPSPGTPVLPVQSGPHQGSSITRRAPRGVFFWVLGSGAAMVVIAIVTIALLNGPRTPEPAPTVTAPVAAPSTVTPAAPAPDTTGPTLALQHPVAGQVVSGRVPIRVGASDDSGVKAVRVSVDGVEIATTFAAPLYLATWTTSGSGPHTIKVDAEDNAGNVNSTTVEVTANNAPAAPKPAAPPPPAGLAAAEKSQILQRADQLIGQLKIPECEQAARMIDDALKKAPDDADLKQKKQVIDATLKYLKGGGDA